MSALAAPPARRTDRLLAVGCAAFFVVVQLYTSLDALAPTPPVGYVFASRPVAAGLVAVLVLGAAIALRSLLRDGRPNPVPRIVALGIGPWLGATALSALCGVAPLDGAQILGVMLLGALVATALVRSGSAGVCRSVLAAYLASGAFFCAAALAMLALHKPLELSVLNHDRAAGFFVTANQFAAYLILLLPIAAAVTLAERGALRALAAAAALLALPALALTFSRSGWIGAAAGACVFASALGARRVALGLAAASLGAALVVLRRPVALNHNPSESLNRLEVWQGGVRALELFPLTGAGPMGYWRVYPALRPPGGDPPGTFGALHPHNVLLSLGGDLGLVGLAAAGFGWSKIAAALRDHARTAEPRRRILIAGFAAAFVASLAAGMFDTIGVVQMCFVWIPYAGLALAVAERGIER